MPLFWYGDMTNYTDADFILDTPIKYVGGDSPWDAANQKEDVDIRRSQTNVVITVETTPD